MTYENLRSTKLLATHCAVCARPLRDAVSVELGIGPDCREKHGYDGFINDDNRALANALIFEIADKQSGLDAVDACRQLMHLGFTTLASKIAIRIMSIRVLQDPNRPEVLLVTTPYTEIGVQQLGSVPGRRWNASLHVNEVPVTSKNRLWKALRTAFPGYPMLDPHGDFYTIPAIGEANITKVS